MDLAVDQASSVRNWLSDFRVAELGIRPTHCLDQNVPRVALWRQGRIVTQAGRLIGVHGRWWPHWGSWAQVIWDLHTRHVGGDRCELFYYEAWNNPGYLTLSYIHSGAQTSLSTLYLATLALDEIARLRNSQAIVCHVTNDRITDRLLRRWGWQAHCPDWSGRHFIKRFYGVYPELRPYWRRRLMQDNLEHYSVQSSYP